jgi:anti-sigma B factor antagonist
MTDRAASDHFDVSLDGNVAVVRVLDRQIRHTFEAQDFGEDLALAIAQGGYNRVLIDLSDNDYLCSTAFAVLINQAKELEKAGGVLKLCCLDPNVLTGANIIGLGRVAEIFDERRHALDAF